MFVGILFREFHYLCALVCETSGIFKLLKARPAS